MTVVIISIVRVALLLLCAAMLIPVPLFAGGISVKDAAGRQVVVGDSKRTVSVGGSITEILYELGADQRIVAPLLFEAECRTPQQMQLANAFCRYLEMALAL